MTCVICNPWKKTFTLVPFAPLTVISPLLDLWFLVLGGGCVDLGFPTPTTMHLTNVFPFDGFIGNLRVLTCQYNSNGW